MTHTSRNSPAQLILRHSSPICSFAEPIKRLRRSSRNDKVIFGAESVAVDSFDMKAVVRFRFFTSRENKARHMRGGRWKEKSNVLPSPQPYPLFPHPAPPESQQKLTWKKRRRGKEQRNRQTD